MDLLTTASDGGCSRVKRRLCSMFTARARAVGLATGMGKPMGLGSWV